MQSTACSDGKGGLPSDFLEEALEELSRYKSVSVRGTQGNRHHSCRRVSLSSSARTARTGTASKVLLATGLVDELPELTGVEALYGVSVHHCLYCDGFEYAGKPVAAYGKDDKGAELAVMMKHWMSGCGGLQRWHGGQRDKQIAKARSTQHSAAFRADPDRLKARTAKLTKDSI